MSDVKDAVKLEPGEWIVSEHRSPAFAPGAVVDVVAAGPGDPCPWVARSKGACPSNFVWFHDNGVSLSGQTRLARKVNCESARIASLEAHNAALQTELDSLREYKRLSENDALIRRIREVCEKHDPASLELEPYAQVYAIECVLDGQAGALNDWHEFFEFAANGETALSVIERYEAWKAARKNSPVAKAMLRTMEGGEV